MQVQIEQVHWSGLKGSEMSIAVMGELRVVVPDADADAAFSEERGGGGGCMRGATEVALRFGGGVSLSLKRGETGLGAVVDWTCGLPVVELA
jgi:hypothetical protein